MEEKLVKVWNEAEEINPEVTEEEWKEIFHPLDVGAGFCLATNPGSTHGETFANLRETFTSIETDEYLKDLLETLQSMGAIGWIFVYPHKPFSDNFVGIMIHTGSGKKYYTAE